MCGLWCVSQETCKYNKAYDIYQLYVLFTCFSIVMKTLKVREREKKRECTSPPFFYILFRCDTPPSWGGVILFINSIYSNANLFYIHPYKYTKK